jgi:hypothetical protein
MCIFSFRKCAYTKVGHFHNDVFHICAYTDDADKCTYKYAFTDDNFFKCAYMEAHKNERSIWITINFFYIYTSCICVVRICAYTNDTYTDNDFHKCTYTNDAYMEASHFHNSVFCICTFCICLLPYMRIYRWHIYKRHRRRIYGRHIRRIYRRHRRRIYGRHRRRIYRLRIY